MTRALKIRVTRREARRLIALVRVLELRGLANFALRVMWEIEKAERARERKKVSEKPAIAPRRSRRRVSSLQKETRS
jgi:hypothetical protein